MDLGTRKNDLADRLKLLMRETTATVELVNLLFKSCERIVDEVCDTEDRCIFLSRYHVVMKYLDNRIHHALQFNCVTDNLISQDIDYANEVSVIEALAAGDASQPSRAKLSEGPGVGVASIRYREDDRRPTPVPDISGQSSSSHTSNQSQGNTGSVVEGGNASGCQDFSSHDLPDIPEDLTHHQKQLEGSQSSSNQSNEQNIVINDSNTFQEPITAEKDKHSRNHNKQPTAVGSIQPKVQHDNTTHDTNKIHNPITSVNDRNSNNDKKQTTDVAVKLDLDQTTTKILSALGYKTRSIAPPIIEGLPESVHRPVYVGEERDVMLSYIETPGEFYVHIACEENTSLDEFQEEMNAFYENNAVTFKSKSIAKARLGNFCVCYQPELGGWCRTQVLSWCLEEEHIEVQLVDYGDICIAFLDVVQPLLPKFTQQPLYATRCHLAFIEPPPPNDTWPPESAKVFNCYMPPTNKTKLMLNSTLMDDIDLPRVYTIVKAEVKCVLRKENKVVHQTSISVILRDDSDGDKLTMNDNLVDLGYAGALGSDEAVDLKVNVVDDSGLKKDKHNIVVSDKMSLVENWVKDSVGSQSQLDEGEWPNVFRSDFERTPEHKSDSLQDWNPMKEDYLDPSLSRENAVLAVSGYDAQDEKRVCKFFAKNGHCYKGIHCRMEHSFSHQDGYTTDKELIYTHAFNPLSMPAEESVIHITVTHVPNGRNYFYSILPSRLLTSRQVFDEETLETLSKHINDPKIIKTFSYLQIPPALGQIVLVLSKTDSSWHRARVVAELDDGNDTIEVVFVDSGKTETIHENNVRAIEPSMLHLPFQAIECYLANVDIDNPSKANEYFRTMCLGKTLIAKIVKSLEDVQVIYCLLLGPNGKDVGQLLIEAGFGFEKDSNSQLIMMPL